MSASARASFAPAASARSVLAPLAAILGAGLILRLLFITSDGFHNDVAAFESWTLTLRDNPPWQFYAKTNFSDYPPGYFVVLWVIAKLYALVGGAGDAANGWPVLRVVVKLPAIAMDLVNAWVVYLIVRRYAAEKTALIAAAVLALNPAAIYASAYWGQVDSVSWGLVLVALLFVLRAGDEPNKTVPRVTLAWLAFAFSILIKPQAATLALLFVAYPFATTDAAVRARRLAGTGAGIVAALALALVVGLLFHPAADVFGWLFGRYAFGSGVYAYNSVNAFNLYALRQPFWQADNVPMSVFGAQLGTLAAWGIALVVAATALIVGRYLQRRDDRALLEAALLCALAFFILATRMHERYVYGAFLLAVPLIGFGRTGGWSSFVLTVTMYLNLAYSLAYQTAMETHAAVDARDLWPAVSHPAALANVVLFFWLGYLYLGGAADRTVAADAAPSPLDRAFAAAAAKARGWFDPREGIVPMTRRDWMFAGGIGLGAFVIAVIGLAWPPEKIFDEVYFARAGEEYLRNVMQFEWTHPPFTKLLIALSMFIWGGLHGLGDTSFGWRFLNVATGSLECVVIYAFAKRLTGQTWLAASAAALLALDGFHFVEERIATGEITIATLALLVLYALYRYLLAAQVRVKPLIPGRFGVPFWIAMVIGTGAAALLARLINTVPANRGAEIGAGIAHVDPSLMTYVVAFVYFEVGVYLLARWIGSRRPRAGSVTSYADGTVVTTDAAGRVAVQQPEAADSAELKVRVDRAGAETYATPAGTAAFAPSGVLSVDGTPVVKSGGARVWLIVLAVALGLLLSSKWNGFLDLGIVWSVVILVSAQRFFPGRALYGNPRGFPIDIVLGVTAFTAATIYLISYIPFFRLGNGFSDLIALQQQMYWYHSHGVANATHPYSSRWWQWPIEQIPVSYYYKDFRAGIDAANSAACCVAEILALPNPAVFLLGLVSVPFTAWLAWRERNKGYALLVLAYVFQWIPYAFSPRIMWEYHFFPNLAVIVLCDVVLIGYVVRRLSWNTARWTLGVYGAVVVGMFAFFYPVLAGTKVTYAQWYERMWPDRLNIPGTSWIIPHRDR
ncbi:MAG TPA: phospholipid carrier-dependent glycosyltransferase [Candidatus Elarobacter sp.]|nr:phospholipid carrier-dependent glycosyltransferase [Candidatus Elarobacter sp.]